MTRSLLVLLLAGMVWAGPASRLDHWRIIGPGGAGGASRSKITKVVVATSTEPEIFRPVETVLPPGVDFRWTFPRFRQRCGTRSEGVNEREK